MRLGGFQTCSGHWRRGNDFVWLVNEPGFFGRLAYSLVNIPPKLSAEYQPLTHPLEEFQFFII
jgi:hypothetical protein